MGKFTCGDCNGLCCLNPPSLSSLEEIKRAKELGVELVATIYEDNKCIVSVAKDERGMCPFLVRGKIGENCKIYDQKFTSCENYTCQYLDKPKGAVRAMMVMREYPQSGYKVGSQPYTISKKTARELFKLKPLDIKEAIKRTALIDKNLADLMLLEIAVSKPYRDVLSGEIGLKVDNPLNVVKVKIT